MWGDRESLSSLMSRSGRPEKLSAATKLFQRQTKQQTYPGTDTEDGPTSNRNFPDGDRDRPPRFTSNFKTATDRQAIETEGICESSYRHAERQFQVNKTLRTWRSL
jgi:hypothetical protein